MFPRFFPSQFVSFTLFCHFGVISLSNLYPVTLDLSLVLTLSLLNSPAFSLSSVLPRNSFPAYHLHHSPVNFPLSPSYFLGLPHFLLSFFLSLFIFPEIYPSLSHFFVNLFPVFCQMQSPFHLFRYSLISFNSPSLLSSAVISFSRSLTPSCRPSLPHLSEPNLLYFCISSSRFPIYLPLKSSLLITFSFLSGLLSLLCIPLLHLLSGNRTSPFRRFR